MSTEEPVPFYTSYYPVGAFSAICFLAFYKYACPKLAPRIFPEFQKLSEDDQIYWHTSVTSSIHAVIQVCLCLYSLFFQSKLIEDPVWGDSQVVKTSCAIMVGYLFTDISLMLVYLKCIGGKRVLIHHLVSLYACYYVMSYNMYVYFANLRFLSECSTPFVNNRWFLDKMNKKSGKFYLVNGLVLVAVFFLCRIVTIPYGWSVIYSIYGTEPYMRSGFGRHVLLSLSAALDLLNISWFLKLCIGAYKTLQKRKKHANL